MVRPEWPPLQKTIAGASLVSEFAPVSVGDIKDLKNVAQKGIDWARAAKGTENAIGATKGAAKKVEAAADSGKLSGKASRSSPSGSATESSTAGALHPNAGPFPDPDPRSYNSPDLAPDTPVVDHVKNRASGGHPTDPQNLDPKSWESNSRKAGFEGNLAKDREKMIEAGMDRGDVQKALAGEQKWIENDVHARPVDPAKLDRLPAPDPDDLEN